VPHLLRSLLPGAAVAALLVACATSSTPESSARSAARAAKAMGADNLTTLRYSGEGTGWTFGQAYVPGGAWPKITLHSVARSIDYGNAAMREEVTLSRAEPQGGGGYPLSGQQRNDQYLSGDVAWNLAGTTPAAGPRFVAERIHQLWITPHGAIKAAQRNNATIVTGAAGGKGLSFTQPGRFSATVWLDPDGLVQEVASVYPDPVLGDTRAVTTYAEYRDFSGVMFPGRVRQTIGGYPVLDLTIKEVQPNAAVAIAVPDAVRDPVERVTADKVADGVWFLGGGSHNSVLIERADHLVLVETPLNDARTAAVIAKAKETAPGKPIRYAINSHQHFDHAGGVRAAVAEGATIVAQASAASWFDQVLKQPNALRPDLMAQVGQEARLHRRRRRARAARRGAADPVAPHRRQRARAVVPARLPAEGQAADRGRRVHATAAERAAAVAAEREQPEPHCEHRAARPRGRPHPAAARPRGAARRSLRHRQQAAAGALTRGLPPSPACGRGPG
jgi:glyoxylase-like metal-dependent hydrolase (beta-lactamase superfamily II)